MIDDRFTQLTWLINQGPTPSVGTGPTTDSAGNDKGIFTTKTKYIYNFYLSTIYNFFCLLLGKYIYLEASYPANLGDKVNVSIRKSDYKKVNNHLIVLKARLSSTVIASTKTTGSPYCFKFWYHMFGVGIVY